MYILKYIVAMLDRGEVPSKCILTSTACVLFRGPMSQQFPTKTRMMSEVGEDPGQPLFLTPYIEKGDIATGGHLLF